MRCQICNQETENFSKNKYTGKYESICSKCRKEIMDCNRLYDDIDEDVVDDNMSFNDFLNYLKEIGECQ